MQTVQINLAFRMRHMWADNAVEHADHGSFVKQFYCFRTRSNLQCGDHGSCVYNLYFTVLERDRHRDLFVRKTLRTGLPPLAIIFRYDDLFALKIL